MKTAIIGLGRMGQRHLQIVQSLNLNVVGVCDTQPKALETVSAEYQLSSDLLFQDAGQMLSSTRPECVIIATTAPTHCMYTCLAAEAGARLILCEKPMACSLNDCDRMIEVCEANGVHLSINHQMRFMEQYTEPKRLILSEAFGGLSSINVVAGNFGLAMNGSHYFEMFRFMTDEQPYEVTSWLSADKVANPRGEHFEDKAGTVRLTTASGKRFFMDASTDQGHGMQVIYAGPYGQIWVDELTGLMRMSVREAQYRDLPSTRYGMPHLNTQEDITPASATAPTRSVLMALLSGEGYPTALEGRSVVEVLVAAHVSDENGHSLIRLNETKLPTDRKFPWA